MKNRTALLVLVLLIVGLSTAYAGSSQRIGTAGATELLIPVGSRGTAMGGSVVANTEGVEAIYWNPAGLATLQGTEAMFMHLPYLASIDVDFAGVATAIEGFGTLGASAKIISIGDIEQTTEAFPEGNGSIYSPTLAVIGLTYARTLTANVQFGVNAMVVNENVFQVKATGASFDLGVIYDPRWRGLKFGIVIKNYGPNMRFSGEGFQQTFEEAGTRRVSSTSSSFELPSSINLGASYDAYAQGEHQVVVTGNFRSNNFSDDLWQGGAEYSFEKHYFVRAGYCYSAQDNYMYGASFGGGVTASLGGGATMSFEYTWRDTKTLGLDDNHFFTVRANF